MTQTSSSNAISTKTTSIGPRKLVRAEFDRVYDKFILNAGFFEREEYYLYDKERYWRSLGFLASIPLPRPARILEIGGGQLAILCKKLFDDDSVVGDISDEYNAPLVKAQVPTMRCNLMDEELGEADEQFDVVICLEVIEHLPLPAYVIFERLKKVIRPGGVLFLTTPNLFRLRNLARMLIGKEFLDRFMLPSPGQGLGHQLEYSADHLRWQIMRAGLEIILLTHDELGRVGHSRGARLARWLLSPLTLRPLWRDGLVAAARKPEGVLENPARAKPFI